MSILTPLLKLIKTGDGEYGWGQMGRDTLDIIDKALGTEHNTDGTHKEINTPRMNVNGLIASADGRIKVTAIEFEDGSSTTTASAVAGAGTLQDVVDAGSTADTSTMRMGDYLVPALAETITKNAVGYATYETAKDSDGGTKITKGNLGTSMGNQESKLLIVLEAATLNLYDMNDPLLTLLKTWVVAGATSVAVLNGKIVYGSATGLYVIDLIKDEVLRYDATDLSKSNQDASTFNQSTSTWATVAVTPIVNTTVNDVAATALPDAPIENGLPVPTIHHGTAAGGGWVKDDGTVVDATGAINIVSVSIDAEGRALFAATDKVYVFNSVPASDIALTSADYIFDVAATTAPSIDGVIASVLWKGNSIEAGTSTGLFSIQYNESTPANSMVAKSTGVFSTGNKVGDTRRCFLANSKTADRSVKAATLTEVGAVTETINAGGRNVYSGFSAANYFEEASHADWNALGTGDFSILMSGVKWGSSGSGTILTIGDGTTAGSIWIRKEVGNTVNFYIHNGASFVVNFFASTLAFTDVEEHAVEYKRTGGVFLMLVDGMPVAGSITGTMNTTISNSTGFLRVGEAQHASAPARFTAEFTCFRISATAPTDEQSKFIADQENALNGGALCLLTADAVTDLAYNEYADVLAVETAAAMDYMKGLLVIQRGIALTGVSDLGFERIIVNGATDVRVASPALSVRDELASGVKTDERPYTKTIQSSAGSVLTFPEGSKPLRVFSAAGTYISLSINVLKFDGFIYYLDTGVAASTNYDCELVRV